MGKTQIENVKTCGPSPWPTLSNGMSYSCVQSISMGKTGKTSKRLKISRAWLENRKTRREINNT